MNISTVGNARKIGKTIGTAAGFGAGGVYLLKNGKDIFQSAINTVKVPANKNKAIGIAVAVCAAVATGATLIGRAIGGTVGKIIDKHNEKKTQKELVGQMIQEKINSGDVKEMTIEELEKLAQQSEQ